MKAKYVHLIASLCVILIGWAANESSDAVEQLVELEVFDARDKYPGFHYLPKRFQQLIERDLATVGDSIARIAEILRLLGAGCAALGMGWLLLFAFVSAVNRARRR